MEGKCSVLVVPGLGLELSSFLTCEVGPVSLCHAAFLGRDADISLSPLTPGTSGQQYAAGKHSALVQTTLCTR